MGWVLYWFASVAAAADEDGDGLDHLQEAEQGSSDAEPDSDHDGVTDLQEYDSCRIPATRTDCLDPTSADTDSDTLTDLAEYGRDSDGDGSGDGVDPDDDDDGVPTASEVVVGSEPRSPDSDADSIPDGHEWPDTTLVPPDADADGTADLLDDDDDGDGLSTLAEALELAPDGDGIPNHLDLDSDGDGVGDAVESTTDTPPAGDSTDEDHDGIPDFVDAVDSDGGLGDGDLDGLTNAEELALGSRPDDPDSDGNLLLDSWEVDPGPSLRDTDGDSIPDLLDDDDDGDGAPGLRESGLLDPTRVDDLCVVACEPRCTDGFVGLNPGLALFCDFLPGPAPVREELRDTDGDGLADVLDDDDDNDGVLTLDEVGGDEDADCDDDAHDADPEDGPAGDYDRDGIQNHLECEGGLDPYSADTDGDGVGDGFELEAGDTDLDGIPDVVDIDDDGDGIGTRSEVPGAPPPRGAAAPAEAVSLTIALLRG